MLSTYNLVYNSTVGEEIQCKCWWGSHGCCCWRAALYAADVDRLLDSSSSEGQTLWSSCVATIRLLGDVISSVEGLTSFHLHFSDTSVYSVYLRVSLIWTILIWVIRLWTLNSEFLLLFAELTKQSIPLPYCTQNTLVEWWVLSGYTFP